ncbi:MAG: hypothetical protein ABIR70_01985 [Bryobacteraceae bacterium]
MPNRSGLLTRLLIAAVIGAVIVVCVVMPAEYRKDPTGFGRLTGLLELSSPHVVTPAPTPAVDADAAPAPDANSASFSHLYETPFRTETIQIPIGPDGELEYKVNMKAGQSMIYSWSVNKGAVYYDFHGEAADPTKGQKYNEVQETKSANGAFTAPFDGKHGWYWLNVTGENIVVTLKVTGFYESHGYVK